MRKATGMCAGVLMLTITAVNPRAEQPQAKQSIPAAASDAKILRFKKVSIPDLAQVIGGEALSFLAPAGWQLEGGLVWRLHPTMPAAVSLRLRNPAGLEQLECFPTVAFSWGGYLGPGTMFPPGANYLGNEVQPPVRDAIAYLIGRQLPRARGGVHARVVRQESLPELADAARAAEAAPPFGGPQMAFTAARIRIEYTFNDKAVEEDLYCVLNSIATPQANLALQVAARIYGLRAEKGRLDDATRLFQTIIDSTRINLQWFSKYVQLVQALTQAQMDQIRSAGELSRYISRTNNEISDMIRRAYENRQASEDRINKNWSQYMRGVDEYYDPVQQRPVQLPSGYNNAWVNSAGEYVVTDSVNFNPNVDLGGNWQKLNRR